MARRHETGTSSATFCFSYRVPSGARRHGVTPGSFAPPCATNGRRWKERFPEMKRVMHKTDVRRYGDTKKVEVRQAL